KRLGDLRQVARRDAPETGARSQRVTSALMSVAGTVASSWRRCGEYVQGIGQRRSNARPRFSGAGNWFSGRARLVAASAATLLLAFIALRSFSAVSTTEERSSSITTAILASQSLSYPLLKAPSVAFTQIPSEEKTPAAIPAIANRPRESVPSNRA